jgi:predicted RNA methylase
MMTSNTKQYWSMTEGVFNCLIDEERTVAFNRAISNIVKKGDVVVDMGTGSGILALLAAKAGAKKVYAIEFDKNNINTLTNVFKVNDVNKVISIIEGNVTEVNLPEKVDVIVGEMIATALIEELQVLATNNILRFAKADTKVLLKEYKTFVDLVCNNEDYYGQNFKIIRYEYPDLKKLRSVSFSDKHQVASANLTKINGDLHVDKEIEIKIKKNGLINSVRLSGEAVFFDNSVLGATFAFNYPIILPVNTTPVKIGDIFIVHLRYEICGGLQTLKYSINKKVL